MTWVKICGTTDLEDALVAVEAGADAVGFVFYEKSPRRVAVETVRNIVDQLPEEVEKVGVFVNEPPEHVSEIAHQTGLTAVQFHGEEYRSPERYAIDHNSYLCIPAEWVANAWEEKDRALGFFNALPRNLRAILLDSSTRDSRGGTGKAFNWRDAKTYVSLMNSTGRRVVVAGGLRPDNVNDAMEILTPWGVDVVSGVEAWPGKKDPKKVKAFVKAVREMDRKVG